MKMADILLTLDLRDINKGRPTGNKMDKLTKKAIFFHLYLMRIHFHMLKLLVTRGLSTWIVKFSKHSFK